MIYKGLLIWFCFRVCILSSSYCVKERIMEKHIFHRLDRLNNLMVNWITTVYNVCSSADNKQKLKKRRRSCKDLNTKRQQLFTEDNLNNLLYKLHKYAWWSQKAKCKVCRSLKVRRTLKSTKDPLAFTRSGLPEDTVTPSLHCPNLLKIWKLKKKF